MAHRLSAKKQCAFLTTDDLEGFYTYDQLLYELLQNRGWTVTEVPWREQGIDWDQFDVVVIRSPWDYQDDPEAFLEVLEQIHFSDAELENPLSLVHWNIDKRYLKDIKRWGIPIVPTLWELRMTREKVYSYFQKFNRSEIIIKPVIGANADDTFRIDKNSLAKSLDPVLQIYNELEYMVQPFVKNIMHEGEYSLFYFADTYSHTILKTPKEGDFRVQEEHGGILKSVNRQKKLIEYSDNLLQNLDPLPLYSRIDYVRTEDGFKLMELELIEPSLYFNMDSESSERFAAVLDKRYHNFKDNL